MSKRFSEQFKQEAHRKSTGQLVTQTQEQKRIRDLERQVAHFKATQSMSRRGNCWADLGFCHNAVAQSFFATMKKEVIYGYALTTRQTLRAKVFEYIECGYNRTRRHSTIGWVSPIRFEHNYQQRSEVNVV